MRRFPWPIVLILAGCATPPREQPPAPPAPPAAQAPAAGDAAWPVTDARLEIRVYRDGPMQQFGHDHLVTTDRVEGEVAPGAPLTDTRFTLRVPLETFVVDDAAARTAAGGPFAAPVPAKDADGTRRNMLGEKLLDAAHHPVMTLASESVSGGPGKYEARVRVTLAGAEHVVTVPFTATVGDGRLSARATLRLTHADLGLVPYAVALGALRVREEFDVDLRLTAGRGP